MFKTLFLLFIGMCLAASAQAQVKVDSQGLLLSASNGDALSITLPKGWILNSDPTKPLNFQISAYPAEKKIAPGRFPDTLPKVFFDAKAKGKNNANVKDLIKSKFDIVVSKIDKKATLDIEIAAKLRSQGDLVVTIARFAQPTVREYNRTLYLEDERAIYVVNIVGRTEAIVDKHIGIFRHIVETSRRLPGAKK